MNKWLPLQGYHTDHFYLLFPDVSVGSMASLRHHNDPLDFPQLELN